MSISESTVSSTCKVKLVVSCEDCRRGDVRNGNAGFSSSSSEDSTGVIAGVRRGIGRARGDCEKRNVCFVVGDDLNGKVRDFCRTACQRYFGRARTRNFYLVVVS